MANLELRDLGEGDTLRTVDEVARAIEAEDRPLRDGRWLLVNMVASVDGATAVDGVSGSLGGAADRAVFLALRGVADVVLVGSGTVIAERYRRARLDEAVRERRVARGQAPTPRIAVVSNLGDVDRSLPLFEPGPSETRPLVLVAAGAVTADRRRALEDVAEVIETGNDRVDLPTAMTLLAERAGPRVTCEGGPVLNGLLAAHDLIDEWCLTLAPTLVAGGSARPAVGPSLDAALPVELRRVWRHGDELLLRYVRTR
jgi:riboflavin biosynthesis pyrimidine reductase